MKTERLGSDSVKLSLADDHQYIMVRRDPDGDWTLTLFRDEDSWRMDYFDSAEEAIDAAKTFLEVGKSELDEALRKFK